jgi:hypothetical protein
MKPSRLRLVHKRKPQADDLSFMPPYSEQARYIELANTFLARNGFVKGDDKDLTEVDQEGKSGQKKIS